MQKVMRFFKGLEWRLSLILQMATLVGSFAFPFWAVKTAELFKEYEPFSWVVAGFVGVAIAVILYLLWQVASLVRTKAKFNILFTEKHPGVDPMKDTFENRRIFLNEFALPTDPWIENKTFINCDIVGPANMFFGNGVAISESRGPNIDVVYLPETTRPTNGFGIRGCIFRGCAFHRITFFASHEDYISAPENVGMINWVSLTPGSLAQMQFELNSPSEGDVTDADI
jgi:hypothetical protein